MPNHYPIRPVLRGGKIEASMRRPVREPKSAMSNLRPIEGSKPKLYDAVAEGWADPPVFNDPDPTNAEGIKRTRPALKSVPNVPNTMPSAPNVPNTKPSGSANKRKKVIVDPDPTPPGGMARPSMDDIIGKYGSI